MQIARISQIDTSKLGTMDRTIIKLRQWRAKLLAGAPPVVVVNVPEEVKKRLKKSRSSYFSERLQEVP